MNIEALTMREPYIKEMMQLWEASVRSTHHFLTEKDIHALTSYVPQALLGVEHLIVICDKNRILGFLGCQQQHLEMLFLDPSSMQKGLGKQLLLYGMEHYQLQQLTVNEQNPKARAFYEHMGFVVTKRSDLDEQGNPFPILTMERK